ncbi:hypothetical protein B0H10DRAFT_2230211 [Mycena sp. CBHHK59/15]|nr:hypothetical protein B0H10DRAFT_2230211 [Mycena sp. CBHHK59/15]
MDYKSGTLKGGGKWEQTHCARAGVEAGGGGGPTCAVGWGRWRVDTDDKAELGDITGALASQTTVPVIEALQSGRDSRHDHTAASGRASQLSTRAHVAAALKLAHLGLKTAIANLPAGADALHALGHRARRDRRRGNGRNGLNGPHRRAAPARHPAPPRRTSWDDLTSWHAIFAVNLFGALNVQQTFVPSMLHQENQAAIINTGSKQDITNPPGNAAYNASKAAIKSMTSGLAHELRASSEYHGPSLYVSPVLFSSLVSTGWRCPASFTARPSPPPCHLASPSILRPLLPVPPVQARARPPHLSILPFISRPRSLFSRSGRPTHAPSCPPSLPSLPFLPFLPRRAVPHSSLPGHPPTPELLPLFRSRSSSSSPPLPTSRALRSFPSHPHLIFSPPPFHLYPLSAPAFLLPSPVVHLSTFRPPMYLSVHPSPSLLLPWCASVRASLRPFAPHPPSPSARRGDLQSHRAPSRMILLPCPLPLPSCPLSIHPPITASRPSRHPSTAPSPHPPFITPSIYPSILAWVGYRPCMRSGELPACAEWRAACMRRVWRGRRRWAIQKRG